MGLPVLGPAIIGAGLAGGGAAVALENTYQRWRAREKAQSYVHGKLSSPEESRMAVRTRQRRPMRPRKRRFRRRRYGRRVRTVQPYSMVRRLKTVFAGSMDAAAVVTAKLIKLNSAYDPTGDIGTGQALGFDQYTALYQRCAVVGWKVKIEYCTTDNTYPVCVGFTPMVKSSALNDYSYYKELPGTVSSIVTPDQDKVTLTSKGGVKKFFLPPGGKLLTDDTLTHGVAGDPSRILYGHLWYGALDGSSDPPAMRYIVTIEQLVVFFVPEIPARS